MNDARDKLSRNNTLTKNKEQGNSGGASPKKVDWVQVLAVAFFFVFTVLFYGPLGLYLQNSEELFFSLQDVLLIIVPVSLFVLVCIVLLAWLLPRRVTVFLTRLLFGIALAMYIQGTLINTNYGGVLNGKEIDWSNYTKYGVWTLLVWLVCLAVPFLLPKIKKLKPGAVMLAASLFLTAIQIPALVVELITYTPAIQGDLQISKDGEFEFAEKENIVILTLDTLDEDYYQEYIAAHPETEALLDGFVHYDNTLASGAFTILGVPSMLTGEPFLRESTYSEYISWIWAKDNPISALHQSGYDVRIFSEATFYSNDMIDYVDNFTSSEGKVSSYTTLAKKLYKLTAFKFSQHFLKPFFWFDTAEFSSAQTSVNRYTSNDGIFYKDFQESGVTVSKAYDKAFRYYLLNGVHSPYKLTRDAVLDSETTSREEQVEGLFKIITEIIADMKEKGIYDSSAIILTCDHGEKHVAQHSAFLYKAPFAENPYSTSHAPVSVFDLPVLLYQFAGIDENGKFGTDFRQLKEDDVRQRHFFFNPQGTSKINIEEYVTSSYAGNYGAMELIVTHEDQSGDEPVFLGTELLFDKDATGSAYAVEGFGSNTGYRSRINGPYAKLSIPIADLPADGNIDVHISLHHKSVTGQQIKVLANGAEVLNTIVDKDFVSRGIDFTVPVSSFDNGNTLNIEFLFPGISQEEMQIEMVNKRTETISLTNMTIR